MDTREQLADDIAAVVADADTDDAVAALVTVAIRRIAEATGQSASVAARLLLHSIAASADATDAALAQRVRES